MSPLQKSSTNKPKDHASFAQKLLSLIAEPEFIKFEHILSEPNFFKIVGRAHYERWHSAFFGWLLDADGSHLLKDYVLRKFLLLLLDERCLKSTSDPGAFLVSILPIAEFVEVQVVPNENSPTETSVAGVGRFDIFLTAKYQGSDGTTHKLNIVFELKIDSKPSSRQSTKYANWLFGNHSNDTNLLIYVTPKLLHDSKSTVGDERWYCLDYQLLNDKLLIPLIDHPNLNEKVKPFIVQYIKNLKTRYRGLKMAITNEERALAVALYEKYGDIFDSLYDALVSAGTIDFTTSDINENKGRSAGRIAVKLDNRTFSKETVRLLFEDILKHIVDQNHLNKLPLPWGSSKNRYIITSDKPPVHPNGRAFFYPVTYKDYTIESHYARDRALKVLGDLCDKLELEFEAIVT